MSNIVILNSWRKGMSQKGQGTVEYIILVAAVIAVAIAFLSSGKGPFQTKMNSTYEAMTNQMTNVVSRVGGP